MGRSHDRRFGRFLKELRLAARLSRKEAAALIGVKGPEVLRDWEMKGLLPPEKLITKIAKVYAIREPEFFDVLDTENDRRKCDCE